MTILGSVDLVTTTGARGWAYSQGRRSDIVVQAVLSHEVIGDAVAHEHRPDLAAVGMGKGNCGYAIEFYREISPLYLPFVSIKVDGGDAELPRGGQLGFGEFFAAFYRANPGAGRPRSMLGGLWTDRTDAAAILKAKVEIEQIDPETATTVAQLIHDGIAIIALPEDAGSSQSIANPPGAAEIAALIEPSPVLAALRAVLDDNPMVLQAGICTRETALMQPSAECPSPSAAECLVIVAAAAGRDIAVDIERDGHELPEFTPGGVSRWTNGDVHAAIEIAAAHQGLLARYAVPMGSVAIIGPGTIYSVRCIEGAGAVKICCAPSRAMPLMFASGSERTETVRDSGVRVWL